MNTNTFSCVRLPFRGFCAAKSSLEKGYSYIQKADFTGIRTCLYLKFWDWQPFKTNCLLLGQEHEPLFLLDLRTDTTVISITSLTILSVLFFADRTDCLIWMTLCWPWGSCSFLFCFVFSSSAPHCWKKSYRHYMIHMDFNTSWFQHSYIFLTQLYDLLQLSIGTFLFFLRLKDVTGHKILGEIIKLPQICITKHHYIPDSSDKGACGKSPENGHSRLQWYFKTGSCLPATEVLLFSAKRELCAMC